MKIGMKILLIKLLIFEIISGMFSLSDNVNERNVEINHLLKKSSNTSSCGIVKLIDILDYNEIFLFCYEFEFPQNVQFYRNFYDYNRNFKFILKSFFVSRIISENIELNQSSKSEKENKKIEIEYLDSCIGVNYDFTEKEFKKILKKCNMAILIVGNMIKEKEILELQTSKSRAFGYEAESYINHPLGQNKKLEENIQDLIRLELFVFSLYIKDIQLYKSEFLILFFINKMRKYIISSNDITDIGLKKKLIEKSKMKNYGEDRELNFRFPKENEKDKMLKELVGLFDYSILLSNIRREINKGEEEMKVSNTKMGMNSITQKKEDIKEKNKSKFNFILSLMALLVILILGTTSVVIIIRKKNSIKL